MKFLIPGTAALFILGVPLQAAATDVCALSGSALRTKVEAGAAEIAEAYANTPNSGALSLNGSSADAACNWTCGTGRVITPLAKTFNLLQYNCSKPIAGPRPPVGRKTDRQMGLSVTDLEYRDATDKIFRSGSTGVGDLMRVPPSIEQAAQDGSVKLLTNAVQKIPGATWMQFSSTSVDNDGEGAARVLIRVVDSQARFEQWIQVAIDGTGKLGRNVDFLAVQRVADPSSPLTDGRPIVAFRGFSRTSSGFVPEGPGSVPRRDLSKCYSCHATGVRAVIPAPTGTRAADGRKAIKPGGTIPLLGQGNITEITTDMPNGLAEFGPIGYTAAHNGPPLGPSLRPEREQFVTKGREARHGRPAVAGCAAGLTEARRKAIVANMDCQSCHDGMTERNIVNAGTNLGTLFHKVVENNVAPMPPDATLSQSERRVLYECLKAEYADILQEWLTSDLLLAP